MDYQGTERADVLTGGADSDVIYGFGGNDTVKGGAGDDVLAGNDGNDILSGGDGDDYILGGAGNDTIDGGAGNDWAAYEDATAAVKIDLNLTGTQNTGGSGTDKLTGIENVYGSDFNDTLTGNADDNMMVGGKGNDTVSGGKGNDTLWGSAGTDTLDGGDGDDYLVGGAGDDIVKGGAGSDWSSYEDATAGVKVDLKLTGAQDTVGAGKDTLSGIENLLGSQFADTLQGDAKDNYLTGGAGADNLYGGAGDDHLEGGAGDDFIDGGDGFDVVSYEDGIAGGVYVDLRQPIQSIDRGGAHGNDRLISIEALWGSAGNDTFIGNASENYLAGNGGDDVILAVGGHDVLEGGDGNDILTSSTGADGDMLLGGAGNDILTIGISTGTTTVDGGEGRDTLRFSGTVGVTYDLSKTGLQEAAPGLKVDVQGIEDLTGGEGNDHLTGDAKDNILTGGAGDDVLNGGAGFDMVSYEADGVDGGVTIDMSKATQSNGAHGVDTFISIEGVWGTRFDDTLTNADGGHIYGGAGNDKLFGTGGGLLVGGDGDDTLTAVIGGDDLYGGAGNDMISLASGSGENLTAPLADGGAGDDYISFQTGFGHFIVDGGEGSDWLDLLSVTNPFGQSLTVDLRIAGEQALIADRFYVNISNIENVRGSGLADHIIGNAADNIIEGFGGDDVIDGGAGFDIASYSASMGVRIDLRQEVQDNSAAGPSGSGVDHLISIEGVIGSAIAPDTLTGNDAKNYLSGLGGNDTLSGLGGDDILVGGTGDNTLDGGDGSDTVDYSAATSGMNLDLGDTDWQIGNAFSRDRMISIENLTGSKFDDTFHGNSAVNTLLGGAGGDELFAVGGGDTLDGGEGDDILHASATADGDVLIGGKGEDIMWGHAGRTTFKFAVGDSVANADGSGADVINGFHVADRLVFKTGAFAWSYAEKTATSYGEAFGLAQERLATGEAGMNFTAVKVGSDVFVFAGEVTGQSFALQNVVKLAGVGLDAIDYYDFLGG